MLVDFRLQPIQLVGRLDRRSEAFEAFKVRILNPIGMLGDASWNQIRL